MTATTPSMKKMPAFIACAMGESFCPKHTGQASATRGTPNTIAAHKIILTIYSCFAFLLNLAP